MCFFIIFHYGFYVFYVFKTFGEMEDGGKKIYIYIPFRLFYYHYFLGCCIYIVMGYLFLQF